MHKVHLHNAFGITSFTTLSVVISFKEKGMVMNILFFMQRFFSMVDGVDYYEQATI